MSAQSTMGDWGPTEHVPGEGLDDDPTPRHGDPCLPERFWSKTRVAPSGCWLWTAGRSVGYGIYQPGRALGRHPERTHRVSYEGFYGAITDGRHVHHLCEVKLCVNPSHLELVTQGEHSERHPPSLISCCRRGGHEYTPENTYLNTAGKRECRTCIRERRRENRAKVSA